MGILRGYRRKLNSDVKFRCTTPLPISNAKDHINPFRISCRNFTLRTSKMQNSNNMPTTSVQACVVFYSAESVLQNAYSHNCPLPTILQFKLKAVNTTGSTCLGYHNSLFMTGFLEQLFLRGATPFRSNCRTAV